RRQRRERIEKLRRLRAGIADVLPVEAELVAVRRTDVREVVDDLRDVLFEVESRAPLARAGERTAESDRRAGDARRRSRARIGVDEGALVAMGVLKAQLVQLVRPDRRDELAAGRVHRIQEVRLRRYQGGAGAGVVRRVIVESDPASRQAVVLIELVVDLA